MKLARYRTLGHRLLNAFLVSLFLGTVATAQPTPVPTANEQPKADAAKVYIGGTGTAPHIQTVLDDLADYLRSKRVSTKSVGGGDAKSRGELVEQVKTLGGESLLYLTLDVGGLQQLKNTLKAQCVKADGDRLWEEAVSTSFATSSASAVKSLIKKMQKKLDDHVGKPGLSVSQ